MPWKYKIHVLSMWKIFLSLTKEPDDLTYSKEVYTLNLQQFLKLFSCDQVYIYIFVYCNLNIHFFGQKPRKLLIYIMRGLKKVTTLTSVHVIKFLFELEFIILCDGLQLSQTFSNFLILSQIYFEWRKAMLMLFDFCRFYYI